MKKVMKVFEKSEVLKVELKNSKVIKVGDSYGDGIVFSIITGDKLSNYIKSLERVDNKVIKKEVVLILEVVDGDEGWNIYLDDEGNELIDF